jgi:hypothetical protein
MDRGACKGCGRVFSEGRPAARRRAPTFRQQRVADERRHVQDLADARGVALGLVDAVAFYQALREREVSAVRIVERLADRLVAFEARCMVGDVPGAVLELRRFIAAIGGSR